MCLAAGRDESGNQLKNEQESRRHETATSGQGGEGRLLGAIRDEREDGADVLPGARAIHAGS